jgi:dolichol-phosphate mannosyltransferase
MVHTNAKVLLGVPTLNEAGNIVKLCKQLRVVVPTADILFVDDDSTDGTAEILDELASNDPQIYVEHRKGVKGIGSAHKKIFEFAFTSKYDVLVTLDSDFTHDPNRISEFLFALKDNDVVVGSRFVRAGSLPGWAFHRRLLTHFGHFLTKFFLDVPCDATGAFRAYKLSKVTPDILASVRSKSYPFFFESMFVFVRSGLKIFEIPVVLPARTYGTSKLTLSRAVRGGMFLLGLALEYKAERQRSAYGSLRDEAMITWDDYWRPRHSVWHYAFALLATAYRSLIISPLLCRLLRQEFQRGSKVLHAGCGSGKVDKRVNSLLRITALDLSTEALKLYRTHNQDEFSIVLGSITKLPLIDGSYDGVYNLGVMEHFEESEIILILKEFKRVLKKNGKLILFWPHQCATSVAVIRSACRLLKFITKHEYHFHPPELTLIRGKEHAVDVLAQAGFKLKSYNFNIVDGFVQARIVADVGI